MTLLEDGAPIALGDTVATWRHAYSDDEIEVLSRAPEDLDAIPVARIVIEYLREKIARIDQAVEGYRLEAAWGEMPAERQQWFARATHARSRSHQALNGALKRRRELAGGYTQVVAREPGEGIAKQNRLRAEAEASKSKDRRLKVEAGARRALGALFRGIAKRVLSAEQFTAIEDEAQRVRKAMSPVAGEQEGDC